MTGRFPAAARANTATPRMERTRTVPALLRQLAEVMGREEPHRAPNYDLASRLHWAASDLLEAAEAIAQTLCPGDHKPRRHGDGRGSWCDTCGRDRHGRLTGVEDEDVLPRLREDRVDVTCMVCHHEVVGYRGEVDPNRARVRTHRGRNLGRGAGLRCLGSGQLVPVREVDRA